MFPRNIGRPLPGRCRPPKAGSGLGHEDPTSDLDWYHGSRVAQGDSSLVPAIEVGLVGVVVEAACWLGALGPRRVSSVSARAPVLHSW